MNNDPRNTVPSRHHHIKHLLPESLIDAKPYKERHFPNWPVQLPSQKGLWAPSLAELEFHCATKWRNYQIDILNCLSRFILVAGGRRGGKTTTCIVKPVRHAMFDVGNYFIGYPTRSQAYNTIFLGKPDLPPDSNWDTRYRFQTTFDQVIPRAYRKYPNKNYSEGNMVIELISGSTIFITGVEYKKGARTTGDNFKMVVLPECANTKNLIYIYENNLQPALSKTKGTTIFESAYYSDNDEFDILRRRAERGEELKLVDEEGYPLYFNCVFTPVDYADTDFEWDQEVLHIGDRAALAQQFYQQRGWVSTRNSIIGQWLQDIHYHQGLLDKNHPIYCVWDIGGACNTSIWLIQSPCNFITCITGNRKTDPNQSTLYYLGKVRDYLCNAPYVIHVVPHDATTKKNLDHSITPSDYLRTAGENVWQMDRFENKLKAIGSVIEFLREDKISTNPQLKFDEEARNGVLELQRVKWRMDGNEVQKDKPQLCLELDTFDSFVYSIHVISNRQTCSLKSLAEAYCPSYVWPGTIRRERAKKPILIRSGGKVTCRMV